MRLAGGATLVGGLALAACGTAKPASNAGWPTLVFMPDPSVTGATPTQTAQKLVAEFLAPFEQSNHVNVKVAPNSGSVSAMVSGSGADVSWGIDYASYTSQGLFMNLSKLLAQDGLSTTLWPKGQMDQLQTTTGLYALPYNFQPMVYFINYSDFDNAGISYPDDTWTYQDFLDKATALKQANNKAGYYGANISWDWADGEENQWCFRAFGGSITDTSGSRATLSTTEGVQCGNWVYQDCLWPKIVAQRNLPGIGYEAAQIEKGLVSMSIIGTWELLNVFSAVSDTFKWDFLPFPKFPAGRFTDGVNEFYGINVATQHPDLAWTFLKWLTVTPDWQQDLMKMLLLPPATVSLWEQWAPTVSSVAPPLARKQLQWFSDVITGGYGIPRTYFQYDDSTALNMLNGYFSQLGSQTLNSVQEAFATADTQITAYEQQQAAGPAGQVQKVLAAENSGTFSAPPTTGVGNPSQPAGSLITSSNGTYTLTGVGWDVWGVDDACTMAAAASTAYQATWSTRVDSIANLSEKPGISSEAKVGLMARGDLSSNAAMVLISVDIGGGIQTEVRHLSGDSPAQTLGSQQNPHAKTGLIAPEYLLKNVKQDQTNYLLNPIWLQLRRKGEVWTAWTSPDGKTWTQAGGQMQPIMAAAWVGVFATAGNIETQNQGQIQATFSNLSFQPSQLVRLG